MTERSSDWRSTRYAKPIGNVTAAQRICAVAAAILVVTALLVLHPSGEPGVALRDFEAYYSAGATWLAHGDPYSLAIWTAQTHIPGVVPARYEVLPFVGLPATLPFWALFSRLPYQVATIVWTLLLVCALISIVILSAHLLRLSIANTTLTAILVLAFVPITSDFGLGQAALPAYAFAVFALTTPPLLGSIAVALSALQPNVALGLGAMLESPRTALVLISGAIIVYAAGAVAEGAIWPLHYASAVSAHARAERFATIQYTPAAVLYGFGLRDSIAQLVGWIIALGALVLAILGAVRARDTAHRFAILCCTIPFVTGFFHEHDFVVLFIPVLFALVYGRNAALAAFATVLVGVNWLDFAQQPQAAPQDITLAAALFIAAVGFAPKLDHIAAAVGSIAAVALGVWVGHVHPLPIWPNDIQGVAHGRTIAEVWKNEQLQTGLLSPYAAAAVLRSFALLGSALLFFLVLNVNVHHVIERRDAVGMKVL